MEGLSKSEFNKVLSFAAKDSPFISDGTLYKQIHGCLAMSSAAGLI